MMHVNPWVEQSLANDKHLMRNIIICFWGGHACRYMEVPKVPPNWSCSCQPLPQSQQHQMEPHLRPAPVSRSRNSWELSYYCKQSGIIYFVMHLLFFYFALLGRGTEGIWRFPGQGLNPSHSWDNTRSLTPCITVGTPKYFLIQKILYGTSTIHNILLTSLQMLSCSLESFYPLLAWPTSVFSFCC